MADDAALAQKAPFPVEIEAGKRHFWCHFGKGVNEPFCDRSHADTGFRPVPYNAEVSKKAFFCGCKRTGNQPLCDGTHGKI